MNPNLKFLVQIVVFIWSKLASEEERIPALSWFGAAFLPTVSGILSKMIEF